MIYVGIDVSKLTFVVAYSSAKSSKTKTFKNTAKGIREFIKTISVDEHHCVMEATGNYSTSDKIHIVRPSTLPLLCQ